MFMSRATKKVNVPRLGIFKGQGATSVLKMNATLIEV